jgi:hypothetical protein
MFAGTGAAATPGSSTAFLRLVAISGLLSGRFVTRPTRRWPSWSPSAAHSAFRQPAEYAFTVSLTMLLVLASVSDGLLGIRWSGLVVCKHQGHMRLSPSALIHPAGSVIIQPPARCPRGHILGPNEVLVGHLRLASVTAAATPPGPAAHATRPCTGRRSTRLPRHRAAAAGDDSSGRQAAQHRALPMLRRGMAHRRRARLHLPRHRTAHLSTRFAVRRPDRTLHFDDPRP